MPQALVYVFTAIGASVGVATVAAYAITLVGTLALSSYQKRKADRLARAQFDAAQVDRLANVPGTVAPRELVLGRVRKGGHVFYRTSVGQYKELFIMCIAVASHEIDGIEQVYFNDQPVTLDVDGKVTTAPYGVASKISTQQTLPGAVTVLAQTPIDGGASLRIDRIFVGGGGRTEVTGFTVSGNVVTITEDFLPGRIYTAYYQYSGFNSFAHVRWHLGSPGQAADGALIQQLGGAWTEEHRAAGIAYLVCSFAYNDTAFPSGIPNVTVRMRGAKVYDPRTGTTQFTENPALMMRHVMLHPQFGKRTAMTAAEDARIIAAANTCDLPISYFGTDMVEMFRASCVFPFGTAARDVLDDMSQAMGGEWAYAAGEFFVRAGNYQLPVMDFFDKDLAVVQRSNDGSTSQNGISISPHRARNDKFNTVAIRIWDEAANYVQTPITPFRADALVAADGAEISQEVTMPAVFYAGQAFHIAGIMLRDSRDPLTISLPLKMSAYAVELFDTVTVTLSRYGWVGKPFRVIGRTFSAGGVVQVLLKETNPAIYQYGGGFQPQGYAQNSGLPKPWDIDPPTITDISSGEGELIIQNDGTVVNGVRVTWTPVADQSIANGGEIEVQYRVLPEPSYRSLVVPGDSTEAKFTGAEDLAFVLIRVRSRNSLAVSDWSFEEMHQVIGKTAPPPNIENLTISGSVMSWTMPRRVPDLAGFVFRFQYGNNTDWGSAAPLHNGLITESPYDLVTRPGGVVTIMGKAQDTSGNQSQATANIVMNLGDAPIANIIEQWDFKAMGWPYQAGEQSGWTLVSGDPTADALDSLYGTDDQSFYGADLDPFYDASAYGQMVYVTEEISINSALAGSIMTLATQTQGTDLHVDYRLAGPGSLYGSDSDPMYGPDAEPFYDGPGEWQPWPGQLAVENEVYQFRVTIGAGVDRGILQQMVLTIDAPDMEEEIPDLVINAGGTAIPYTKNFTYIKTVQATLQANASGAETLQVTKTTPLIPFVKAYNAAGAAVSGATADITLKGY
ncbi:hypothetical protein ABIC94_002154 [Variovorax paradoxus]|uniref:phage tail protein n=1 Tax=Variovorax paradoxus TaxID=34073 RepID=UPI00339B14D5